MYPFFLAHPVHVHITNCLLVSLLSIFSNRDWSVYFTSKLNMLTISVFVNLISILSSVLLYLFFSFCTYLCYSVFFMLSVYCMARFRIRRCTFRFMLSFSLAFIYVPFLSVFSFLWRLITHHYVVTVVIFLCTYFHWLFEQFIWVRDYGALGNATIDFNFVNGLTLCVPWANISYHCPP